MIGYDSAAEAAYVSNYPKDWNGLQAMTAMPMSEFKNWARDGKKDVPLGNESSGRENSLPRIQSEAGPEATNAESPAIQKNAAETNAPLRATTGENQFQQKSSYLPDSPKKTTTRELDAKRLTDLDRSRADSIVREYDEVAGKSPAKLYDKAVIKFKDGNLYVNAEATELLRHADSVAFKDAESFAYFGRYLSPKNSARIENALKTNFGVSRLNFAVEAKKRAFLDEFEKARKASQIGDVRQIVTSKTALYGLKAARQEETAHPKDYSVGFEHKIAGEIFQVDPIWARSYANR